MELCLGAEEVARRAPREAGRSGDLAEAGAVEASLGEELLGGAQDLVPAALCIACVVGACGGDLRADPSMI
jgi:hypothetical protein